MMFLLIILLLQDVPARKNPLIELRQNGQVFEGKRSDWQGWVPIPIRVEHEPVYVLVDYPSSARGEPSEVVIVGKAFRTLTLTDRPRQTFHVDWGMGPVRACHGTLFVFLPESGVKALTIYNEADVLIARINQPRFNADRDFQMQVERLESDDPRERSDATELLKAMLHRSGLPVAARLRDLLDSQDPEVRGRARAILIDGGMVAEFERLIPYVRAMKNRLSPAGSHRLAPPPSAGWRVCNGCSSSLRAR